MVTRDLVTGTVTEHGPLPGEGCGDWFGDATTGRLFARSGDRLWLGPFDGPWDVEVELDESMNLNPGSFGSDRLVAWSSSSVSILSSTTGEVISAPITMLDAVQSPAVRLSADGQRVAVASRADATQGSGSVVLILDAVDGTELTRSAVPGRVLDLFFDSEAGQLLASTTDSRLHTIDATTGDVIATVPFDGVETYNLAVRPDGLVVVISTGSPSRIELVDREVGPLRAESLEFSGLAGGILRTDGAVLTWDFTFEVDVVDLDARLLVDQSFAFDAIVGSRGVPNTVSFGSGMAVLVNGETMESELVDLSTGVRSGLNLRTANSEMIPSISGPIPLPGGFWQISEDMELSLWEQGELVAQSDLGAGRDIELEGFDSDGRSVVVSGRLPNGTVEVHVLDLGEGEIRDLFTSETGDIEAGIPTSQGGLILIGSDGVLRSYRPEGHLIDELDLGSTAGILGSVRDGGHRVALVRQNSPVRGGEVTIVDLEDRIVRVLPSFGEVRSIGWARSGKTLDMHGVDGSVNLWDVESDTFAGNLWIGNGSGFGSPWYDEAAGRNLTQDEWDRLVPGGGQVQSACG